MSNIGKNLINVNELLPPFEDFQGCVAEPPNLMPPRSTCLPLDAKYLREDTKLRGSVEHTPRENPQIHIFPSGSQMRE